MQALKPAGFPSFEGSWLERHQLRADLAEALYARMEDGHLVWECDHTLRHTEGWLKTHGLNVTDHLDILPLLSVFCDCEVLGIDQWPPFDETWLRVLVENSPRE